MPFIASVSHFIQIWILTLLLSNSLEHKVIMILFRLLKGRSRMSPFSAMIITHLTELVIFIILLAS